MEMEKTEGKVLGYDKKILAIIAALVIVAGGAFYIGAKYEKSKLSKLGLLKGSATVSVSTKKAKQQQPAVDNTDSADQTDIPASDTNPKTLTPAPGQDPAVKVQVQ